MSFEQVASDLLHLTKLDLNSSDLCSGFPITLARCQEIGNVLKVLGPQKLSIEDRYYPWVLVLAHAVIRRHHGTRPFVFVSAERRFRPHAAIRVTLPLTGER
jgi:rRNA maturation protein Nop10